MERKNRDDRFTEIEDRFAGYTVYDMNMEKIGKVDDLFVDENDQPEYVGVKMGFLGLKSTLIPMDIVRVNEKRQLMEVSQPKDKIKDAPTFDDDEEITSEFEQRVYSHFGLQRTGGERGGYGGYYRGYEEHTSGLRTGVEERTGSTASTGTAGAGMTMGDREEDGRFHEHLPGEEGIREREDDLEDTDELRIQRSEEELRAGTREREAGAMRVRKRVHTDREQVSVPRKREEISVDRVPVNQEASETEIGENEVSVPVVEEEIVVEKQPVVKEEVRVRKDVVEDEEIVEEDVRKEEVDVEDTTERRSARRGDV